MCLPWRKVALAATMWLFGFEISTVAASDSVRMMPATVRDGVEMTTLAFQTYAEAINFAPCGIGTDYSTVANFSPDGSQFAITLRRGDTKRGVNRYLMYLWKTAHIEGESPSLVLEMDSSSMNAGIDASTVRWTKDGRGLTFIGETPAEHAEVYSYNLESRKLTPLTASETAVVGYSLDSAGAILAYEAVGPKKSVWNDDTKRHGLWVTSQTLNDVSKKHREQWPYGYSVFVADRHGTHEIKPMLGRDFIYATRSYISPNGRYLIILESVASGGAAGQWENNPALKSEEISFTNYKQWHGEGRIAAPPYYEVGQYVLVDLQTGASRPLLDAPIVFSTERPIIWSPDSESAIISHTLLPVSGAHGEPETKVTTVEVAIKTGAVVPVEGCLQATSWEGRELSCSGNEDGADYYLAGQPGSGECSAGKLVQFWKQNGAWHKGGERPPPLSVFLKEGLNLPAALYYKRAGAVNATLLMELNPQLKSVKLAMARLVTWKWSRGHSITGALYYPPSYHPGERLPLVIQTHVFNPRRFDFWGGYSTSTAAQPLAARGIFVLQLDDLPTDALQEKKAGQLLDAQRAVEIYKTAISYLSRRGLIDPKEVGIIGFSHTCFYVKWALTQDPQLFAAASVAEGGDGGYPLYMLNEVNDVMDSSLYDGPPYGRYLKSWEARSPLFNIERVRAPLLIVVLHRQLALYEWGWLNGLRDLRKPVSMLMVDGHADDDHVLQEPWDVRAVAEGNVDWFDFWLNRHQVNRPEMQTVYAQWTRLRAQYQSESRTHPISWKSVEDSSE